MKRIISLVLVAALSSFCVSHEASASGKEEITVFYVSPCGDDAARGTQKHPWQSVEGAAAKVAEYMEGHPGIDVVVKFAGGEYRMRDSVAFEGLSSALRFEAAGDGEPVICGSMPVTKWEKLTDASVLSKMPAGVAGKIWQADLRANGIADPGNVISRSNRPDLYYEGRRQTLSRWPDKGMAEAGKAVGATDVEETWINVHGTKEGVLEYTDDRMAKWAEEDDAYVFGYWYWDWADGYSKLASVDTVKKTFSVAKPWSYYGYRDGMRFYGLNLLCELDSPGEYYLDRGKGVVYWYAPDGFDPEDSHTEYSVMDSGYMITVSACDDFSIDGFTVKGGRNGAVTIIGGRNASVSNCRFTCFGENAVWLKGGLRHRISGCKFDELGAGGIRLSGGDRVSLKPCGFCVENTIVDNFSLFKRTYEPAVWAEGVGMTLSNNLFTHSSSSALRLDGNDILVQYCQFYDLVTESDDQGASDSWFNYTYRRLTFKYNHFRNIRGGMFAGAGAIRFDDIISGNIIYGNVFERCGGGGFGAVNIHGGRDNHMDNNVFYDCPSALTGSAAQGEEWKEQMRMNKEIIDAVNGLGPVYAVSYPELRSSYESEDGYNFLYDNIVVNYDQLCAYPDFVKKGNNTEISGDTLGLSHYLQPSVQKACGLSPIPFGKIGVKSNRFAE